MKFRLTRRSLATSIISLSAALALTSCGSDFTAGFLFLPLSQINSSAGGGVNVFRIEHNFGKLTLMNKTPVSSGGANAVQAAVVGNGRFLYVVNQATAPGLDSAVVLFSIGGTGVLAQQQGYATQGTSPIALTSDSNSGHLYVVDQIAPAGATCPTGTQPNNPTAATSLCGDITAYTIDNTTGRLSLIQNQNSTDPQGTQLTYFPVGKNPIKVVASSGFLFVLDQGDSTIFPYQIAANGQLTLTQNGPLQTGGITLTAISSGGKSGLYVTDAGTNQILPYTIGAGGSLSLQNGGPVANQATGSPYPDAILVDSTGKFLYVANRGANPNTNNPNSSISAFTIDPSNGKLQPIANGPFPADSGANCLVEDPSNQYVYASAFDNSSVKGSLIRSTGELQPLKKGTTFALTGNPTCVVASGRVN